MVKNYQLVLIDGSSYLFRAYHALPQLVSSKGQPTGAIKGVISMIRKLMSDYPYSHIAVVFDAKGKSFRNEIYSEYKANRPATMLSFLLAFTFVNVSVAFEIASTPDKSKRR